MSVYTLATPGAFRMDFVYKIRFCRPFVQKALIATFDRMYKRYLASMRLIQKLKASSKRLRFYRFLKMRNILHAAKERLQARIAAIHSFMAKAVSMYGA